MNWSAHCSFAVDHSTLVDCSTTYAAVVSKVLAWLIVTYQWAQVEISPPSPTPPPPSLGGCELDVYPACVYVCVRASALCIDTDTDLGTWQ